MRKDHFSSYAESYARFRPEYPPALIDYFCQSTSNRQQALDCGTGNGQVASQLVSQFETVYGIDISPQQMAQSDQHEQVTYMISAAESTIFADDSFDLITAGQCYHWFDEGRFWQEMKRIGKPGATVALFGYDLLRIEGVVGEAIQELYYDILGNNFWDPERKKIEQRYSNIEFPCEEISFPEGSIKLQWNSKELLGYISTWSAIQKYLKQKGSDPMHRLREIAASLDPDVEHGVTFPIFGRLGRFPREI